MVNTIKLNTGASVKDYNKVSDWLSFEIPDKIFISSGKVDIGQHISTTLALISSREFLITAMVEKILNFLVFNIPTRIYLKILFLIQYSWNLLPFFRHFES